MYNCHPTYGEWAVDQAEPKMRKLKCFNFFLKRLAGLDRLLQQEESLAQGNITRVEMCGGLTEEMAAEEQQAVEECMKVGKQRIRWADLEESQIEGVEMKSPEMTQKKGSGTGVEKWVSYDTAVEEHEAVIQRQQKEEAMMAAGLVEMNRDKTQDWAREKDSEQFKWEEWDSESMVEEDGSAREAFEPRGNKGLECQRDGEEEGNKERQEEGGIDGQEEGGKERQEEGGKERQEEGGKEGKMKASKRSKMKERKVVKGAFRRQDDDGDDEKHVGRGKVVRQQCEEDKQQGGWSTDVWKGDENEKRMEMGKGGDNSGERVNLEDFFRRFKQAQGEQQQQGGRDESREKDGGCEQRQEIDWDERERLRRGIGQGKGMRKGQGKGKGEIDEQKDWEERWRVKKENWMNEQWERMSEDDLGMGQTGEIETRTVGSCSGCEIEE